MVQRTHLWRLLLLLALVGVAFTVHAAPWSPGTFPNPQKDLYQCGRRGVRSMICDPDGIMSYEDANVAEAVINKIGNGEKPFIRAPCGDLGPRGYQVAIALMSKFEAAGGVDAAATAKAFARALHDSWGVGEAACQNGVLLLLSIGDRQSYISTGAGSVQVLPDDVALQILENMKPHLRGGEYGKAVIDAVTQIGGALAGQAPPEREEGDGWWMFFFFAGIIAAVFLWAAWSGRKESARYKSCTEKLEAIKRDQSAIRRNQYAATTCPICFDDFERPGPGEEGAPGGAEAGSSSSGKVQGPGGEVEVTSSKDTQPLLGRSGSASSGRGSSGASGGKTPLVLRCGHTFCEPCISEWVKKASSCPVCRKDLNGDDAPTTAAPGAPRGPCSSTTTTDATGTTTGAAGSSGSRGGWGAAAGGQQQQGQGQLWRRRGPGAWAPADPQWALAEQMFRLRRLHMMYPDYVTMGILEQWEDDMRANRELDMAALRAMAPATRRALESSGRSGTSLSFGGGGGGGGGGAGSSW